MVFPGQNLPLPHRPFPFIPSVRVSPSRIPDCHLVRTVIPCLPFYDSLGVFHSRVNHSLSLFCKHGFQERYQQLSGHNNQLHVPLSPHTHSRQATLHAAHDSAHCLAGSYPGSYASRPPPGGSFCRRTTPGLHGNRVVCPMPLERARNP